MKDIDQIRINAIVFRICSKCAAKSMIVGDSAWEKIRSMADTCFNWTTTILFWNQDCKIYQEAKEMEKEI